MAVAALWSPAAGAGDHDQRRPASPAVGRNPVIVADTAGLSDQIRACWQVPWMTRREDFHVHVVVELRPDRTVRTARVVGTQFLIADPHRRRVAQSARHALLSSRCNPLKVPDDIADKGERITLTFNPADIFGR